jgi:hypothetical protein
MEQPALALEEEEDEGPTGFMEAIHYAALAGDLAEVVRLVEEAPSRLEERVEDDVALEGGLLGLLVGLCVVRERESVCV